MNNLEVLEFINNNLETWEEVLSSSPYNIIIKKKEPFVLLKYNQIESDMSIKIVQECRGLILKKEGNKYKIASLRFTKFFNYGQDGAAKLNFENPIEVSQKIDGSLIGVWYDKDTGWHISTSGNIDASDAPIQFQTDKLKTYEDLFLEAIPFNIEDLNKNVTYMFELISPYNRIIVPYKETEVYLLSIRENASLKEYPSNVVDDLGEELGCKTPRKFNCANINEAIEAVNSLKEGDEHFEGFVLRDWQNQRVKLKSPDYMNLFFIKGEGVFSEKKILKLILDEQDDDILGHFPEYKEDFDRVRRALSTYIAKCKSALEDLSQCNFDNKKELAQAYKESDYKDVIFKAFDYKYIDMNEEEKAKWLKDFIDIMSISKLLEKIRKENKED